MSKLTSAERKARDNERFSQRVNDRREKGEDVVAYALTNKKAVKFLTKSEKKRLNEMKATLQEEKRVKEQEELNRIEDAFTIKQFDDE
ncbi:DNA polymerase III subunit epsilon [Vibrio sp. 10N.261.46.E12]|uniref:DNA polymerase III subunit epsilon n=1 Tax=unclassified Vibrio TaxID=2614977 RepID=UPI000976A77F|nr:MULTISPECIES: DNA polymerase III subunit epsilon [unclassified Vibrio]OMO35980.1 DNA polymerase III subunit epsilon [Vibrio sp. 10N.261.45.E1]PMJ19922.1 DNA polymerase III subunit epsilon [Vibrio sp. 10N.286.45.B6]PML85315.1 DNA polymerase III subunit epsilon [Vibrio sp. 10N.261.49.E11]PMM72672.1 DNA polymerase III subunit epsilon [Vibrio sp. 10N.261.46.F12]PMM84141.1 DNA polymerase III subunit epsilon [Vibrio sp. 10N.261.46.E8]